MRASDSIELGCDQQARLLALARASIGYGCEHGALQALPSSEESWLVRPQACFVTLMQQQQLRGCIGSLQPRRALQDDVNENAYAAAFRDPRFPPLQRQELATIRIELALLSAIVALVPVSSEAALLQQLRPERDGVVIEQDGRRATFLPKVWQQFAGDGAAFLRQLRQKAGLPAAFDPAAQYSVYQVQAFAELEPVQRF